MIFGTLPLDQCDGAILAHSLSVDGLRIRKGQRIDVGLLTQLAQAGVAELTVAKPDESDCSEDAAASALGSMLEQSGVRCGSAATGRCNLYACEDGVLCLDEAELHRFNLRDERITLACLRDSARVRKGEMIGTLKIIPYAVPQALVDELLKSSLRLAVHGFKPLRVTLVQTRLPDMREALFAKTFAVTRARLAALGQALKDGGTIAHHSAAVVDTIQSCDADLLLIVGASAISDRADVIPASIEAAGGRLIRLGMPVDPGNLLCLGKHGTMDIIGLPGCARSPRRNGFDLVLERLLAGLPVSDAHVAAMGAGGLLDEVSERLTPRAAVDVAPDKPRIGAILLAAGRSARMGSANKLLLGVDGEAMVRRAALCLRNAGISEIIAVLGHDADAVGQALRGLATQMVYNPDHASGMASSIRTGLAAAPPDWDGALIMLGDMPRVSPETIRLLSTNFDPAQGIEMVVPCFNGQRGNPVLWGRAGWVQLMQLEGDAGARALIDRGGDRALLLAVLDEGVLRDADDPAAFARLTT